MEFHGKIRELTRAHHRKIEMTPLLNQLIAGKICRAEYCTLINKFHGYIAPCENGVLETAWRGMLDGREKTPLLQQDIAAIGLHSLETTCPSIPNFDSVEKIIGYLYVIEGSTMGGQIITKVLRTNLGILPETGGRYFYGYGKETKSKWDDFCHMLNGVKKTQEDAIVAAACTTFETLHQWLKED